MDDSPRILEAAAGPGARGAHPAVSTTRHPKPSWVEVMEIILIRSLADKPWRSRSTFRMIEAGLRRRWKAVRTVRASGESELRARLLAMGSPDRTFVFNVAEYIDERNKRGFIPAVLDAVGYPHLGSSAVVVRTALDKGRTKSLLARRGIPTPRYFVAQPGDPRIPEKAAQIGFPLLVKPVGEGGHAGIEEDSIVHDIPSLEAAIRRVLLSFHQPSLVEEYIDGGEMREFSVGIVGSATRTHLPLEIDWDTMRVKTRILSFTAAQRDRERVKPVTDSGTVAALNELADGTFDAVGAADYARVDIRGNRKGLFVLEINTMPGLGRRSFMSLAARYVLGFDHGDLVRTIALESIRRQGFPEAA